MKQLLLAFVITAVFFTHPTAQCLKMVKYTVGKMEILDTLGNVQGTQEEPFTFTTRLGGFNGVREAKVEDSLHGILKSLDCSAWVAPGKDGKLVMVCDIESPAELLSGTSITIESKEGKITITLRPKERPERVVRFVVDKYEEIM